jgi:hypothetical protein
MHLIRSLALMAPIVIWPFAPSSAPAKTFQISPVPNAISTVRDTIRTWRAQGHTNKPVIVLLSPGEYTLTGPLDLDARDGDVTWQAPKPQSVLITGGQHLTNFTAGNSSVWHAHTDLRFEQLYVGDRSTTRARLPLDGFFNVASVTQQDLPGDKNHVRLTVKIADTNLSPLRLDPSTYQDAQLVVFHKWDTSRYPVSAMDPAAGTITVMGRRMQPWNPWDAQSRCFVDNCHMLLSMYGMWSLDRNGDLTYRARPDESVTKSPIVVPVLTRLMEIHGANHVHFDGLEFAHTAYTMPPDGCPPVQAAAAIDAAIQVDDAQDVTFDHCEIRHTGSYALWFRRGCRDCRLEHSLLEDLGAGGLRIGETAIQKDPQERTHDIVADNNIIRGCGRVHPSAVGVWIGQSANNRITHNDISDTYYTGVSVGWTWGYGLSLATNNFIGFNRIHRIGQAALSDMGGIYTLGVSPGSACIGNVIYDVRAHDYGGWGIYPDEGSSGWQIESNLVWNCTCVSAARGGAFHQHYGATNYIANNIFALSSGPPMQATRVEDHLSFTLEHNLIISDDAGFFTGPWDKIQFASCSNCFAIVHPPAHLFPNGNLAQWQTTGHEAGSILTNLDFDGTWPDVTLPNHSPAFSIGFKTFDPKFAGVYGDRAWQHLAETNGW